MMPLSNCPKKWYSGGCHCQAIRFSVLLQENCTLDVYRCNCSICWMRQNHHFVVKNDPKFFKFLSETKNNDPFSCPNLTEYNFNTNIARHIFCKICGIQCFYQPRSNPNGFGITIYCMDDFQPNTDVQNKLKVEWHDFDGQNWESQIESSSITSKT